jgi:hypothetical protein
MVHEDQQHDLRQRNGKKGPFYEIDRIHSSGFKRRAIILSCMHVTDEDLRFKEFDRLG